MKRIALLIIASSLVGCTVRVHDYEYYLKYTVGETTAVACDTVSSCVPVTLEYRNSSDTYKGVIRVNYGLARIYYTEIVNTYLPVSVQDFSTRMVRSYTVNLLTNKEMED